MQYHYVGFDKIPEQPQPTMPVQPETIANCEPEAKQILDNELDDATIEEGDEQISGTQQASMMCVENPEALDIPCMLHQLKERDHCMILLLKPCQTQTNFHMVLAHLAVIGQDI